MSLETEPRTAETAPVDTYSNVEVRQDVEELHAVRALLPSVRELASGAVVAPDYAPPAVLTTGAVSGPSLGARLRGLLHQMDPREITAHGPRLPLVLFGYLALIETLDIAVMGLIFPDMQSDLKVSAFALTAINSVVGLVVTLLALPLGYLTDRVHRVRWLAIGSFFSHLSIAMRGTVTALPALGGWLFVQGLAGAVREPMQGPLIADWYPPETRARTYSFIQVWAFGSLVLSPVIAGVVGRQLGWRMAILVTGGVATVLSLLLFLLKEPVRGIQDRLAAGADVEAAQKPQRPLGWSETWRAAAKIRTLRLIWFTLPFSTASAGAMGILSSLLLVQRFHLDLFQRGLLATVEVCPTLIGVAIGGVYADRLLKDRPERAMPMLGVVGFAVSIGTIIMALAPWLWLSAVGQMLIQLAVGFIIPGYTVIGLLVTPARMRGLGSQTTKPWALIGTFGVPLIVGISDSAGVPAALIVSAAVGAVGGIILTAFGGTGVTQDIRAALAASLADEEARKARAEGRNKMLICRDVDVVYDGAQVLFGVDFDVEEGDFVALLGTNGAGKSTLLRAISGIQEASNGAIFLDGDDITHLPPFQIAERGVVMMPGGHAVFPALTVEDNLRAAAWLQRKDEAYVKAGIETALTRFPRLRERLHTAAGDLSGGEQQMIALSQALLMKPRLLMIDELSLGLAPNIVAVLLNVLREIHAQGTTIIIVEQSVNVALQVAQRAVYMEKGEIRFDGTVRDLMTRGDVVHSVFLGQAVTSSNLSVTPARASAAELGQEREAILQLTDVHLHYGGVGVLDGVNLAMDRGDVVGIIGPNGAGKTSLFDVITGFANPDPGTIWYLGRDVTRMAPDARARLGLCRSYQNVRLFPALTVRENIAVALERHLHTRAALPAALWLPQVRKSEKRVTRRVDNVIESLGLEAYANKFVNELSTGTRRIVDIGCLLAAQPRLLLLDEPSSGLAQAESEQLGPVIGRIVKETGCALMIIEHDLGLIASVSDRLVALRQGAVMAEGAPRQVLDRPDVIEAILGGASEAVISRSIQMAPVGVE